MELVFATHNPNKFKEIKELIPDSIRLLSLTDIACDEDIEETAKTIEGNALLKAQYVYNNFGYACFADDTGLEVEALDSEPGVFSARYAGDAKNDQDNIDKLLNNLTEKNNRKAQFKTVIALIIDEKETLFTGICEGEISDEKRGNNGFGYDPIFIPQGKLQTFAEMPSDEKSKISHRGIAVQQLVQAISVIGS